MIMVGEEQSLRLRRQFTKDIESRRRTVRIEVDKQIVGDER